MPGGGILAQGRTNLRCRWGGILASDRCQFYDAAGGASWPRRLVPPGGHPGLGDSFRQGGILAQGRDKNITKLGWVTGLGD